MKFGGPTKGNSAHVISFPFGFGESSLCASRILSVINQIKVRITSQVHMISALLNVYCRLQVSCIMAQT